MNTPNKAPTLNKFTEELENLLKKRIGGSVNFRGIYYQILYASYLILNELKGTSEKSITMEGIEDIDLNTSQNILNGQLYTQVKSSVNKMDAGSFWDLGVLQNFAETFEINPMLSYIQTQQVITNEIYAIYDRLIEKFSDNLNSLARIADSLSIFHSKDSKLVALVIKIFDLVIYLKDQDSDLLSHTRYALYDALTSMGVKTGIPGQPFQVDIELRDLLMREINQLPDYFESKQFLKEILKNLNNEIDRIRDHDNETW